MKTGKTLSEMAMELERQSQSKTDFVADTRALAMTSESALVVQNTAQMEFGITNHAHGQIAARLDIPKKYYDRMRSKAPALLATNVNQWFHSQPERRMIRTLDGHARAFLSERYRRLDNHDLALSVLHVFSAMGNGLQIVSAELTESRMYIKAINQRVELEVNKGDVVQAGICITNSEVGLGALRIEPLVYRLVCLNGMIAQDYATKKYHVGRAVEEDAFELFSDETLAADDKAFFLKVQDTVRATVDIAKFAQIVERMQDATKQRIEGHPVQAVEFLSEKFGYNQDEKSSILTHLIQGGDLSAYGLMNAVTRTSQDLDNYDRATELERDGSRVLSLPASSWKAIAQAK
jgi:hypothetical protein